METDLEITNSTVEYCGQATNDFNHWYSGLHGYVSVLVCLFGSVANTLNIAVLTRREMVSPTNAILTGLAVADLLVMLEYIPYAFHMYWPHSSRSRREQFSYPWACFVYFHSLFGQICHTVSIFLTVTLAVWRYIAIAHPQTNRRWCNMRVTAITIILSYAICPLICLPIAFSFYISTQEQLLTASGQFASEVANASSLDPPPINTTIYTLDIDPSMMSTIFLIYSVVIKLIPCIALTLLSSKLILVLLETKKRRQQLMKSGRDGEGPASKARRKSERQTDRTTRMLLAVLFLFLLTEFPQGIMGLLAVFLGPAFFTQCYNKFGE